MHNALKIAWVSNILLHLSKFFRMVLSLASHILKNYKNRIIIHRSNEFTYRQPHFPILKVCQFLEEIWRL